ncbi:hypothetical protein IGI04_021388 [Brassica rapa subsp. trilocularis]|uniref:FBD domain-containing protein n=1 Tax=Brassica rapa subsp. trilocularis TaxID=1813537 RepID=A0ABQ7LXX8_BRACM|nr:hypothetical protein IGI04_021388 [Brassica rapa subsp. trilocularis]
MAATKMFLIKWYSTSTNLEIYLIFHSFSLFLSHLNVFEYAGFSDLEDFWDDLPVSRLEVVWKSSGLLGSLLTKSSGLPGSRLDFSERFGFSDLEDFWDDLLVSRLEVIWKSSGSRLDFLKVVWTSCKVVWKSSELPKSLLAKSSEHPGSRLDFLEVTTYNSVVHETTEIRLKCKSSGEVKLLKLSIDDLTFSRLRLQISKSIAKITSALTRRLPGKSSTARRLKGKSSTARRLPNSLAYIRLLQAHRITNGSHPPIIVSFYDSMNHKNFRIKILGFFSSLWRESERYVVFSSQEWKKKKGKSILGALRASNWLFMVVVVLMTMTIL